MTSEVALGAPGHTPIIPVHTYREDWGRLERRVEQSGNSWSVVETFVPRDERKESVHVRHTFRSVHELIRNFPEFNIEELA